MSEDRDFAARKSQKEGGGEGKEFKQKLLSHVPPVHRLEDSQHALLTRNLYFVSGRVSRAKSACNTVSLQRKRASIDAPWMEPSKRSQQTACNPWILYSHPPQSFSFFFFFLVNFNKKIFKIKIVWLTFDDGCVIFKFHFQGVKDRENYIISVFDPKPEPYFDIDDTEKFFETSRDRR